jgi:hypothetical protein
LSILRHNGFLFFGLISPWIGADGRLLVPDAQRLRQHEVTLCGQTRLGMAVCLRPLTEVHWPLLYRWYSDPDVLYYSEGDDVSAYSPEDVRGIYYQVSPTAFCFIIEAGGVPVGDRRQNPPAARPQE